jgi:hypothetical protein
MLKLDDGKPKEKNISQRWMASWSIFCIGVPLDRMTIGKAELYGQVGVRMFRKRTMQADPILREGAGVTSL